MDVRAKREMDAARGFTLLEVMVTIAIFAIIAMLAGPNLMGAYQRTVVKSEARKLYAGILEAQGLATANNEPTCLFLDRVNRRWSIRNNKNDDSLCDDDDHEIKSYPKDDPLPYYVELGPATGSTAAFPAPYDGVVHDKWCTVCNDDDGALFFDIDGRILDENAEHKNGAVFFRNSGDSGDGKAQAVVFIGVTGNVRLYEVAE